MRLFVAVGEAQVEIHDKVSYSPDVLEDWITRGVGALSAAMRLAEEQPPVEP